MKKIAYASLDYAPPPTENVNTPCSCNNTIMSQQPQDQQQPVAKTDTKPEVTTAGNIVYQTTDGKPIEWKVNAKQFEDTMTKKEQPLEIKPDNTVQALKSPEQLQAENQLKEYTERLQRLEKELEQRDNFILDKIVSANIPRQLFEKDEDFNAEKNTLKSFIKKHKISHEDSEWLITKMYSRVAQMMAAASEENEKKGKKQTAYASDFSTASITGPAANRPAPPRQSSNNATSDDLDPLF
jgi:hypothetical protein